MIAPSGAWPSVPTKTSAARIFAPRPRPGVRNAPIPSPSVVTTVRKATTRFENSMSEW